jgi:hypothetical protein
MTLAECKYCGKSAGFLRSKHKECERLVQDGRARITAEVVRGIKAGESLKLLESKISEVERSCLIPSGDRKDLLISGWESTVEQFLDDGVLEPEEEARLIEFKDHFGLSQSEVDRNGALLKTTKAGVLRDVLNGEIPQRLTVSGSLPVNFQNGEQVVWAFPNAKYLEDKTRRQYVGRSQGVSIRVMKGVYYRVGAFKGEPVEHTERVHVDSGWFVVTNKNIYFAGPHKSLRVAYAKIVSFEPFSDGMGVMRDAATARPQIFVTGDGWFTYNLVTNLARL